MENFTENKRRIRKKERKTNTKKKIKNNKEAKIPHEPTKLVNVGIF